MGMHQNNHEWDKLILRLDKAGVPNDVRWRTLILYMRNVRGFYFLSERQKSEIQQLIVDTLKSKQYSEERYIEIVKRQEEILLGPHKDKIRMAVDETHELIGDVRDLLMRKKGDVQELGDFSIGLVEAQADPKEMISAMRKAFHDVVHTMEQDMADLTRMSETDGLTGLNNRRAFDNQLAEATQESLRSSKPLCLLLADIDFFKKFNDNYGHRIGDQALRVVAKVLTQHANDMSAKFPGCYSPARYGGEEFAVILRNQKLPQALVIAEEMRHRIEKYNFSIQDNSGNILHQGIKITVSVGVAKLDPCWKSSYAANLVEAADKELYRAKETGRNRVCG